MVLEWTPEEASAHFASRRRERTPVTKGAEALVPAKSPMHKSRTVVVV